MSDEFDRDAWPSRPARGGGTGGIGGAPRGWAGPAQPQSAAGSQRLARPAPAPQDDPNTYLSDEPNANRHRSPFIRLFRAVSPQIVERPNMTIRERDLLRRGQVNAAVILSMLTVVVILLLITVLSAPPILPILGAVLVVLVLAAWLNRSSRVQPSGSVIIAVLLIALSLSVLRDAQTNGGFSWLDVARLIAFVLPTLIGGVILSPRLSWLPFVASVALIVALTASIPPAPDLAPLAIARLKAGASGPRLLFPVMGYPLILNLCAYLLALVVSVSNMRTLRGFYEQSGLAAARAAYAASLEQQNRQLEEGDAILRETLTQVAQGTWNGQMRQLPANHPRYAMVALFRQYITRIARMRVEMESASSATMRGQMAWERVYRHFHNLIPLVQREMQMNGGAPLNPMRLTDLVTQMETGYTGADGALQELHNYLVWSLRMRLGEAEGITGAIRDVAQNGQLQRRAPRGQSELAPVAEAVNALLTLYQQAAQGGAPGLAYPSLDPAPSAPLSPPFGPSSPSQFPIAGSQPGSPSSSTAYPSFRRELREPPAQLPPWLRDPGAPGSDGLRWEDR